MQQRFDLVLNEFVWICRKGCRVVDGSENPTNIYRNEHFLGILPFFVHLVQNLIS